MCQVCGCGSDEVHIEGGHHHHHDDHEHPHDHPHSHVHDREHEHSHHPHFPEGAVQPIVINHYYQAGSQVFQYPQTPGFVPSHPHAHEHGHEHDHGHSHEHGHSHSHSHGGASGKSIDFGANEAGVTVTGVPTQRLIRLEKDILEKNNSLAQANRSLFDQKRVFALNLISSPGAGKTTLVGKTIEELRKCERRVAALIGDQKTSRDADRIRATGAEALQINTGKGCHLDAHMVGHAAENLGLQEDSILFIENIGNLVCPSGFDLGEHRRVVMLSVTEGDDKPAKYPDSIVSSQLLLISKIDLLSYVDFDVEACIRHARELNPKIQVIQLSVKTGEGFDEWMQWLESVSSRSARNESRPEPAAALQPKD